MMKKAGLVTLGVSAALFAASPMAFAGDAPSDNGGDHGHHSDDHGHHHGHHSHGHHGQGVGNTTCVSKSGDVGGNKSEGILALGPILDGNSGQLASCNSFLNDVASHNKVSALNGLHL